MTEPEIIRYQTHGTCSQMIGISITDGIINEVQFLGGCNGNLQGISKLVKGLSVDEVIEKLQGIRCGDKPTSCPDQLATCLIEYKQKKTLEIK